MGKHFIRIDFTAAKLSSSRHPLFYGFLFRAAGNCYSISLSGLYLVLDAFLCSQYCVVCLNCWWFQSLDYYVQWCIKGSRETFLTQINTSTSYNYNTSQGIVSGGNTFLSAFAEPFLSQRTREERFPANSLTTKPLQVQSLGHIQQKQS